MNQRVKLVIVHVFLALLIASGFGWARFESRWRVNAEKKLATLETALAERDDIIEVAARKSRSFNCGELPSVIVGDRHMLFGGQIISLDTWVSSWTKKDEKFITYGITKVEFGRPPAPITLTKVPKAC